ncbi:glycine--tRNA ligase subunit beta [Leptolyngbya sp. FACHB-261]|uniref:glycine--tRNA ligase subunit beta n=1 Tax=Leptolyngbya sp. FACHB-261 TaxID=2692806 RepID=UPI001683E1DE|nr:glycine--tRNA ligase subunit beta [Leptolyngbya sp. FACHB-261]MBD2104407.1 glycine--tRNA ligase subunit beta [Leptolyngbya sp. FACHB-261]
MATFLLEVGTEELPASFVSEALVQWQERIPRSLKEAFLESAQVSVYGTPRRLAVLISGLPAQQPDREEEAKGPAVQAAFREGVPTKAAEGFARSKGASPSDLYAKNTNKGEFVFLRIKTPGRPTAEVLKDLAPGWITGLEGKRLMRWGNGDLKFPRPIRWLVALLDTQALPLSIGGVDAGRLSRGHRVLCPSETVEIASADTYLATLEAAFVLADPQERSRRIQAQLQSAAVRTGSEVEVLPDLLAEVVHLVEWPTAIVGQFEPEFLELPAPVIKTEMVSHQRYFPLHDAGKPEAIKPSFITISNGDPAKADIIAEGNARVIRARLSDGRFFYTEDRQQPLESYAPRLSKVTFQEDLGSVADKVERIVTVASWVAEQLSCSTEERHLIERTARLCKADLVTQMVGEFPELQGIMGSDYARNTEPEAVATGIFEHYLPRGAEDALPQSLTGRVVGIADRLDTLVGIFGLSMLPTGSSDPFALRRAANGILNVVWNANYALNLGQLLDQAVARFTPVKSTPEVLRRQLTDFFSQRIRTLLQDEQDIDYDLVNAVLGEGDAEYIARALADLLDVRKRAQFLQSTRQDGTLERLYESVNRVARLATQGSLPTDVLDPAQVVDPSLFQQPSEQALYEAAVRLAERATTARQSRDYGLLVQALAEAAPAVSQFFDGPQSVLVMDPDPKLKQNRLNLLGVLRNNARLLADFGPIVKP